MAKVLAVIDGGIGNQIQSLPAVRYLKRQFDAVDAVNLEGSNREATEFLFGTEGRLEELRVADYEGQFLLNLYCRRKRKVPALPVLGSAPSRKCSEVEAKLRVVNAPCVDSDFEVEGLAPHVDMLPLGPDVLLHNGYSKVDSKARRLWEAKSYPYYVELAVELAAMNFTVGSIGSPEEHVEGTTDCTGVSLTETVAYVKSAQLVIANDTGSYHLANALSIPNIALFTFTDAAKNYDERFHRHSTVLRREDLDCSPCQQRGRRLWLANKDKCKWACREVPVKRVMEEVKRIFG